MMLLHKHSTDDVTSKHSTKKPIGKKTIKFLYILSVSAINTPVETPEGQRKGKVQFWKAKLLSQFAEME